MATSYPASLDAYTRPASTDAMNAAGVEGDVVIDNAYDAIEAIETELGTAPSAAYATVAARLDALTAPYPQPADFGLEAWTCAPLNLGATVRSVVTTGKSIYARLDLRTAAVLATVKFAVRTAGITFTTGNDIGLYDAAGNLLTSTGDLAGVWNSTGFKSVAWLSVVSRPAGIYYIGMLNNSATLVSITAALADGITLLQSSLGTSTTRPHYSRVTTLTALSDPMSGHAASDSACPWFAVAE